MRRRLNAEILMPQIILDSERDRSVLADFDAGDLLDALSLGVIVLDAQLCAVYANVTAEGVLALELEKVRGQPLPLFLPQPQRFIDAVGQALERKESVDCDLARCAGRAPDVVAPIFLRVAPLRDQMTGEHLLVEVRHASASSHRP
jgi:nitrogen-specific signal transduction histidine kinase